MIKMQQVILDFVNGLMEKGYWVDKIEFEKESDGYGADLNTYITCNFLEKEYFRIKLFTPGGKDEVFKGKTHLMGIIPTTKLEEIHSYPRYGFNEEGYIDVNINKKFKECIELECENVIYLGVKNEDELEEFEDEDKEPELINVEIVKLENSRKLLEVCRKTFKGCNIIDKDF